jgi:hypothetical protein
MGDLVVGRMNKTDNQKVIIVVPLIKGREFYFERTCRALDRLGFDGTILALRGPGSESPRKHTFNILVTAPLQRLDGMATIFRAIYEQRRTVLRYSYASYCDDDNFFTPNFVRASIQFLEQNPDYVGCNGRRFLFDYKNGRYQFLAKYKSQSISGEKAFDRLCDYARQGGILFYALMRSSIFVRSMAGVDRVTDDNAAEILINYRLPLFGEFFLLKELHLARQYPRPSLFNVPTPLSWSLESNMYQSLNACIMMLGEEYAQSCEDKGAEEIFANSVGCYLHQRFALAKACWPKSIWKLVGDRYFYVVNKSSIVMMLRALKSSEQLQKR